MKNIIFILLLFISFFSAAQRTKYSENNSTFTSLSGSGTWTGTSESTKGFEAVVTKVVTDQDGELYMEFSPDNTNWYPLPVFEIDSGVSEVHRVTITSPYYRARFVNTSTSDQTYLRLTTLFGDYQILTSGLNFSIGSDADAIVARTISEEVTISEGKFVGYLVQNKFARNDDVDAAEDIWDGGGDYTGFPISTLEWVEAVSTDINDDDGDTGLHSVIVYGLDSLWQLAQDTIILNGTTPDSTNTKFRRVYRVKAYEAGSTGTNEGVITVSHSTTTANVFSVIAAGQGQSKVSNYTIPAGYTGYLVNYRHSFIDKTSNSATVSLWIREFGQAIRLTRDEGISTTQTMPLSNPYGGIKLPEKTDFKFRVVEITNADADVSTKWDLILSKD